MNAAVRQWLLIGVAAVLALGLGVAVGWLRHAPDAPSIATTDIFAASFPDTSGKPQALAQWKGKVLVLNFWATWCPPCRKEIPDFVAMQRDLGDKGLAFVGIAIDDAAAVAAFGQEFQVNYPLLVAGMDGSALGRALGNTHGALPFTVMIDRQGNIVGAKTGMTTRAELEKIVRPLL